jgi:hypothetical protein
MEAIVGIAIEKGSFIWMRVSMEVNVHKKPMSNLRNIGMNGKYRWPKYR